MSSLLSFLCFLFNATATTVIYTLSLHDALPISGIHLYLSQTVYWLVIDYTQKSTTIKNHYFIILWQPKEVLGVLRSEEHTSELQSLRHLVCRLLLEKKKK